MALASVSNARTKTPSATSRGFSPIGVQVQPVSRQVQRSQQVQQAQKAQQPNRGFQPGRQIQRANQQFQESNTQSQSGNRQYKAPAKSSSSGKSESPLNEARRLSNPAKAPASISPLPTAQSPRFPDAQRAPRLPSARSVAPIPSANVRRPNVLGTGGGAGTALAGMAIEQALQSAVSESGYNFTPSTKQQIERNDQIRKELGRQLSDALNGLGNSLKNTTRNAFNDLFDRLTDPFKKHPRTDPKNDDGRPKPTRYVSDWRGLKFYSPNNRQVVQIAAPNGEYSLGEIKHDNPGNNYVFSTPEKNTYALIYWDNLQGNNTDGYTFSRGSATCEPDTIQPDPTYFPPSYDLPALLPPGTTPDPGYPPIFTEDDFKPQRDLNDDRARQDEQDRQDAPDPEQERQDARNPQPEPDPWENPFPAPEGTTPPQPYPFPLDPPSPDPTDPTDPYPDTTLGDRLREKVERIKEKLNERFPAPTDGPQVTINGDPVPSPTFPAPLPDTSLSPLPDTRTKSPPSPTTTKPPTETRVDTTTGLTPTKDPDPTPDTPTPEKCKDPCMQGLHDKTDANSKQTEIKVKVFKSCSRAGADGTTKNEIDFEEKLVKVLASEADAYRLLYSRIFALESEQCGDVKAIASVPEWWQARRGADIPQLAIIFAEQFSSGKLGDSRWTLCIPHYNRAKGSRPAIPAYNKGNWFGTLKLTDGSKLGVNAATSTECKRVLNRLKIHIPVEFRTKKGKAIRPRIVEDPTADLKQCKVTPVRADFYSKGQTNMKPDWSINLRQK